MRDKDLKTALEAKHQASLELDLYILEKFKEKQAGTVVIPQSVHKLRGNFAKVAGLILILTLATTGVVYALQTLLKPDEVVSEVFDWPEQYTELIKAFEASPESTDVPSQITGNFEVTLIGAVSGQNLITKPGTSYRDEAKKVKDDQTYVIVAIRDLRGFKEGLNDYCTDNIPEEFSMLHMSPVIEGYAPWEMNIATLGGALNYTYYREGVYYYLASFENISYFADRKLQVAVYSNSILPSNDAYLFDEKTGLTSLKPNNSDSDINLLFDLKLDPKHANPQEAEKIIQEHIDLGTIRTEK